MFEWNSPLKGQVLQVRPDEPVANPEGDPVKYLFGRGVSMVLNQLRMNADGPLMVQEGTLQSIAAAIYAHEGWSVCGISGCWGWRSGDTSVSIPDLQVVDGRDVVVSLDADAATNFHVYSAGLALQEAMMAEGAHSVKFLWLAGHGNRAGLDDVLGSRPVERRTDYLMRALQHAEEKPAKTRPAKRGGAGGRKPALTDPGRPLVMVNDDRRDVINQITDALRSRWDGDSLFGYGGILARRSGASVQPVTEGVFADLVAEAALCVTISAKGDANPGWPDEKTMKAVLARADQFSLLEKISQVPFVRADGTICQAPGYDEASATFLVLDEGVERIEVPDDPTGDDVRSAVKLLCDEWLGDLFAIMPEPEDRANCLAMMFTPLIRGMVPLAPMAVLDGLQAGVGKNLLADLLAIFATGRPAAPLPYSRDDDENRKIITSSFRAGQELLIFDEAHTIEGRHLAKSITGVTYTDRILGVSNMIEFPNRVTWVALGNNVSVNGDLSRRVYRIRLAPSVANPQDRDIASYRHPDIKGWTRAHRAELISAALTLIRAWFVGERAESPAGRRFGSFEAWGGMLGGILDSAGVEGFLGSLTEWRSETDYEASFWSDHLHWLFTAFGEAEFTVPDVIAKMRKAPPGSVEHPPRLEDHTVTGYNRVLGLAYGRVKNRIIDGLQLVKTADYAGHSNRWRVIDRRVGLGGHDGGGVDDSAAEQGSDLAPVESKEETLLDRVVRVDRSPMPREKNSQTYSVCIGEEVFSGEGGVPNYPHYPYYPSTEGADPLAPLVPFISDAPPRVCPDCDAEEELTPSGFWFSCRTCTPQTFTPGT